VFAFGRTRDVRKLVARRLLQEETPDEEFAGCGASAFFISAREAHQPRHPRAVSDDDAIFDPFGIRSCPVAPCGMGSIFTFDESPRFQNSRGDNRPEVIAIPPSLSAHIAVILTSDRSRPERKGCAKKNGGTRAPPFALSVSVNRLIVPHLRRWGRLTSGQSYHHPKPKPAPPTPTPAPPLPTPTPTGPAPT
jgi:hypothetical protein